VTYTFSVVNQGTYTDTYTLALSGAAWPVTLPFTMTAALAPAASQDIILTVDIPAGATIGSTDTLTLTATSMFDPGVGDSAMATTTADLHRTYLPLIQKGVSQ
jgi:hypothetical protein